METTNWSILRLLSTVARLHEQYENERLSAYGITQAGLILLRVLAEGTVINQARLATLLHIQPQTAGKTLDRLEVRGLVLRGRDQDDRRTILVGLTAAGQSILATLDAEEKEFDKSIGLSDPGLRAALENVIHSLRPQTSDEGQKHRGLDGPGFPRPS